MKDNMINDFVYFNQVEDETIQKYTGKVPSELIDIWTHLGYGTFMNGYLKIINPDDYADLLNDSYFRADTAIPVLATAFGDIITWEKDEFVGIVEYRYGRSRIMISDFDLFLMLLKDDSFIKDFFQMDMYKQAYDKLGSLNYNECYGYVPLLALGGTENVSNLRKAALKEHIAVITELAGAI